MNREITSLIQSALKNLQSKFISSQDVGPRITHRMPTCGSSCLEKQITGLRKYRANTQGSIYLKQLLEMKFLVWSFNLILDQRKEIYVERMVYMKQRSGDYKSLDDVVCDHPLSSSKSYPAKDTLWATPWPHFSQFSCCVPETWGCLNAFCEVLLRVSFEGASWSTYITSRQITYFNGVRTRCYKYYPGVDTYDRR